MTWTPDYWNRVVCSAHGTYTKIELNIEKESYLEVSCHTDEGIHWCFESNGPLGNLKPFGWKWKMKGPEGFRHTVKGTFGSEWEPREATTRTYGVSIPGRQGRDVVIRNIPYTTQYPCRREKARVMCVEHANLLQDADGVRFASHFKARNRRQNKQTKTGKRNSSS